MSTKTILALSLALTVPCGCLSLSRQPPEKQTYVLQLHRASKEAHPDSGVLLVEPVRVDSAFAHKAFVYCTAPQVFESDFYHEFLVPPETALTDLLRAWLQGGGTRVVSPGNRAAPTHALEVVVNELYGDFRDVDTQRAVVSLRATLLDAKDKIVLQRSYSATVDLADRERASLVRGWNVAVETVFADLERDLRPHLVGF